MQMSPPSAESWGADLTAESIHSKEKLRLPGTTAVFGCGFPHSAISDILQED